MDEFDNPELYKPKALDDEFDDPALYVRGNIMRTLNPDANQYAPGIIGRTPADYSQDYAHPKGDFGDIALRALMRFGDLAGNALQLPDTVAKALVGTAPRPIVTFGKDGKLTLSDLLRMPAQDMERDGFGEGSVPVGNLIDAIDPRTDVPAMDLVTKGPRFVAETALASVPDLAASVTPAVLPYVAARIKEYADQRAANNNRSDPSAGDLGVSAIAAPLETFLERATTLRLLPKGVGAGVAGAGAGAKRIAKETAIQGAGGGVEELINYAGTNLGTEVGATSRGALESFVAGLATEGTIGGTVQGGKEVFRGRSPTSSANLPEMPPTPALPPDADTEVIAPDIAPEIAPDVDALTGAPAWANRSALVEDLLAAETPEAEAEALAGMTQPEPLGARLVPVSPDPVPSALVEVTPSVESTPSVEVQPNGQAAVQEILPEAPAIETGQEAPAGGIAAAEVPKRVVKNPAKAASTKLLGDSIAKALAGITQPQLLGDSIAPTAAKKPITAPVAKSLGDSIAKALVGMTQPEPISGSVAAPVAAAAAAPAGGIAAAEVSEAVAPVDPWSAPVDIRYGKRTSKPVATAAPVAKLLGELIAPPVAGKPVKVPATKAAKPVAKLLGELIAPPAAKKPAKVAATKAAKPVAAAAISDSASIASAPVAGVKAPVKSVALKPPASPPVKVSKADREKVMAEAEIVDGDSVATASQSKVAGKKGNKLFTDEMAGAAKARLRGKIGRVSSGFDPGMLKDAAIVAGNLVEKGIRTFVAFSKEMITQFGDGIKPHLQSLFSNAVKSNAPDLRQAMAADKMPPKSGIVADQSKRWKKDVQEFQEFVKRTGTDSIVRQVSKMRQVFFSTMLTRARFLEDYYPKAMAMREMFNTVFTRPGESELVTTTLQEKEVLIRNQFLNVTHNALVNNGLEDMNKAENDMLRMDVFGIVKKVPSNIRKAADIIIAAQQKLLRQAQDAGIDVGEVQDIGYLQRLYDENAIRANKPGFLKAAATLYREFEFPIEVGTDARNIVYEAERFGAFIQAAKMAAIRSSSIAEGLSKISEALKAYKKGGDLTEIREIESIIKSMYADVAADYGKRRADAWLFGIESPAVEGYFKTIVNPGSPVKSRTLSAAADIVMTGFLVENIPQILDIHAKKMSRRIAYAESFGAQNEKLKGWQDAMVRQGVAKEDAETALRLVARAAGVIVDSTPKDAGSMMQNFQTLMVMGLLTKSAFSSIPESAILASRVQNAKYLLGPLNMLWRSTVARGERDRSILMGKAIGVLADQGAYDTLIAQVGGEELYGAKTQKAFQKFVGLNLLDPLTQAQQSLAVSATDEMLSSLAENVIKGTDQADTRAMLNEVGIDDHEAFAKWMVSVNGKPRVSDVFDAYGNMTPMGQLYATAQLRINKQTIQRPEAALKQEWIVSTGIGKLMGAITSFTNANFENFVKREVKVIRRRLSQEGAGAAAKATVRTTATVLSLYTFALLATVVREMLYNRAAYEDLDDEERAKKLLKIAAARTMGFGSLDPLVDYLSGLAYRKPLSKVAAGPAAGTAMGAVDDIAALFTEANSGNTTSAERKAAIAAWVLFVQPTINAGISIAPGGSTAARPLYTGALLASPALKNKFGDLFGIKPERMAQLDEDYSSMQKDLKEMRATISSRVATLPQDQWQAEFDALKLEYPELLDGAKLDVYKTKYTNPKTGVTYYPGDFKRPRENGMLPILYSEDSVMGQLEGVTKFASQNGRTEKYTTEGVADKISTLNGAISELRADRVFRAKEVMDLAVATDTAKALSGLPPEQRVTLSQRQDAIRELESQRRELKRQALAIANRNKP